MKRPARKPLAGTTKEIAGLLLTFCKPRILHYASAKPVHRPQILERLRTHGSPITPVTLNRILLRMERNRWLTTQITPGIRHPAHRAYSLTPQGREVLHLARKRLNTLTSLQQTTSCHETVRIHRAYDHRFGKHRIGRYRQLRRL